MTKCKNCNGFDCDYCDTCQGTGIDPQIRTYENNVKEDEQMTFNRVMLGLLALLLASNAGSAS